MSGTATVVAIPAPIDQPLAARLVGLNMPPLAMPPPPSMAAQVASVANALAAGGTIDAGQLATLRSAASIMSSGSRHLPARDLSLATSTMAIGGTATPGQLASITAAIVTLAELQPVTG